MSTLKVDVKASIPKLEIYAALLGGTALLLAAIEAVKQKTHAHIFDISLHRHDSANRVGGTFTGYLADRALGVQSAVASVSGSEGSFVIEHPGVGRAFHDVTIVPKNGAKYIPIPINARAYGRSPREFAGEPIRFVKKGGGSGKSKSENQKPPDESIPAWLLVESVTQRQDRSLLPSQEDWEKAAVAGMMERIFGAKAA
jgi:hypothetical protein